MSLPLALVDPNAAPIVYIHPPLKLDEPKPTPNTPIPEIPCEVHASIYKNLLKDVQKLKAHPEYIEALLNPQHAARHILIGWAEERGFELAEDYIEALKFAHEVDKNNEEKADDPNYFWIFACAMWTTIRFAWAWKGTLLFGISLIHPATAPVSRGGLYLLYAAGRLII